MGFNMCLWLRAYGKPFGDEDGGTSHVEIFDLGDELQRAAAAIAITKAVPSAGLEIDHELPDIAAAMNGAATDELRPDALELGVEAIVSKDGGEWHQPA